MIYWIICVLDYIILYRCIGRSYNIHTYVADDIPYWLEIIHCAVPSGIEWVTIEPLTLCILFMGDLLWFFSIRLSSFVINFCKAMKYKTSSLNVYVTHTSTIITQDMHTLMHQYNYIQISKMVHYWLTTLFTIAFRAHGFYWYLFPVFYFSSLGLFSSA